MSVNMDKQHKTALQWTGDDRTDRENEMLDDWMHDRLILLDQLKTRTDSNFKLNLKLSKNSFKLTKYLNRNP